MLNSFVVKIRMSYILRINAILCYHQLALCFTALQLTQINKNPPSKNLLDPVYKLGAHRLAI